MLFPEENDSHPTKNQHTSEDGRPAELRFTEKKPRKYRHEKRVGNFDQRSERGILLPDGDVNEERTGGRRHNRDDKPDPILPQGAELGK